MTFLENINNRIWVKGLALECPAHSQDADCPLAPLRNLPPREMNEVLNHLSDAHLQLICLLHADCFRDKMKKMAKK